jgi:hypothetical protein
MIGQVQREEALQYLRGVIDRAAMEALRVIRDALEQEEFTRQDAELLRYVCLRDARWEAQDAAYATMRAWKEDPTGYAVAFLWVAATILAAERASGQQR